MSEQLTIQQKIQLLELSQCDPQNYQRSISLIIGPENSETDPKAKKIPFGFKEREVTKREVRIAQQEAFFSNGPVSDETKKLVDAVLSYFVNTM